MNALNLKHIELENRRYTVDLLNPLEAIEFSNRAWTLLGPILGQALPGVEPQTLISLAKNDDPLSRQEGSNVLLAPLLRSLGELKSAEATRILTEALQRCYTPHNEPLSDMTVFNAWFREYPEDLYPLGIKAVLALISDFFPKGLVTAPRESRTVTSPIRDNA